MDQSLIVLEQSSYPVEKRARIVQRMETIMQRPVDLHGATVVIRNGRPTPRYEEFETMEALIAASLGDDIDEAATVAARRYDELVAGGVRMLPQALDAWERTMRAAFSNNTERLVRETADRLMNRGALAAGLESGLRDTIAKNNVINGLYESAKFYTNDHFSRNVLPDIYGKLDDIYGLNLAPTETLKTVRELAMSKIAKEDHKLQITANGAASKAYHYGVVKGGWDAGFRTYEFVAIVDERTSVCCFNLNGKQFHIADAVAVAERRTKGTPEQVKEFSPWFNSLSGDKHNEFSVLRADGSVRDNAELTRMGAICPPLHARCRSSIQLR